MNLFKRKEQSEIEPVKDKATQISELVKRRDALGTKIEQLNTKYEFPMMGYFSCYYSQVMLDESDRVVLLDKVMNDLRIVHEEIGKILQP